MCLMTINMINWNMSKTFCHIVCDHHCDDTLVSSPLLDNIVYSYKHLKQNHWTQYFKN